MCARVTSASARMCPARTLASSRDQPAAAVDAALTAASTSAASLRGMRAQTWPVAGFIMSSVRPERAGTSAPPMWLP